MTIGILTSENKAEDYCLKEGLIESKCHIKKINLGARLFTYLKSMHSIFEFIFGLEILYPNL